MTILSISTAAECIEACIASDVPPFLWGPPGVGKSQVVNQIGARLKLPVVDFRATLRDPVDLRGLPMVDAKTGLTRWLPPAELPNVKDHGAKGILLLDELNAASVAVQAACFGLVLERRLGEYKLPDGWVPVACGNRMKDRAAAQRMPSALANRFAHFEVEANLDDWCAWANGTGITPLLIAFMRFRPALLHKMPDAGADDKAFPTPRAWVSVATLLKENHHPAIRKALVASLVGDGASVEFEAFAEIFEQLPSIDQVLKNPATASMPGAQNPATMYALAGALARRSTRQNFAAVCTYAARMSKEFETITITDAIKRDATLKTTAAFSTWAVANQAVTL